jgi:hypothetical protein
MMKAAIPPANSTVTPEMMMTRSGRLGTLDRDLRFMAGKLSFRTMDRRSEPVARSFSSRTASEASGPDRPWRRPLMSNTQGRSRRSHQRPQGSDARLPPSSSHWYQVVRNLPSSSRWDGSPGPSCSRSLAVPWSSGPSVAPFVPNRHVASRMKTIETLAPRLQRKGLTEQMTFGCPKVNPLSALPLLAS